MIRLLLLIPLILFSCTDSSVLPSYTGATNEVLIVIDDALWEGSAGDSLRHYLGAEVQGIAWSEPQFDMIQIPQSSFSRFFETHRNIIIIRPAKQSKVTIKAEPYAQQQWLSVVEYQKEEHLLSLLGQYAPIFSHRILEEEKSRFWRKKKTSPNPLIQDKFQLSLSIPKNYTKVLDTSSFVWYEFSPKELELIQGILVYEIPPYVPFYSSSLLAARDSVLRLYVPGPSPGSYMTTEYLHYEPYVSSFETPFAQGFIVKGLWKVEQGFMGGPFLAYFFQDVKRQKTYSIEGFLFNPGQNKRNVLQEMDWTISNFKTVP